MDIKKVSKLANLPITTTQEVTFEKEISEVIEFGINKLSTINVQNVDPSFVITQSSETLAKDEPIPSLENKEVLQNTQNSKNGLFKIKAVFE